ncbi:helitron_like_N domain-containing protein [Trichonephila clavipes]|nr:helitron_like_N domain-containing protein [Trichonephila clavipes]
MAIIWLYTKGHKYFSFEFEVMIRLLRYDGSYDIIGQVINVLVDVDTMVQQIPRRLGDDQAFNVNIKNMIHKSTYLSGVAKKSVVKSWLQFLLGQPLYKHYKITVHWGSFHANTITSCMAANAIGDDAIERLQCNKSTSESEVLLTRYQSITGVDSPERALYQNYLGAPIQGLLTSYDYILTHNTAPVAWNPVSLIRLIRR